MFAKCEHMFTLGACNIAAITALFAVNICSVELPQQMFKTNTCWIMTAMRDFMFTGWWIDSIESKNNMCHLIWSVWNSSSFHCCCWLHASNFLWAWWCRWCCCWLCSLGVCTLVTAIDVHIFDLLVHLLQLRWGEETYFVCVIGTTKCFSHSCCVAACCYQPNLVAWLQICSRHFRLVVNILSKAFSCRHWRH